MRRTLSRRSGFTLIELLVVVGIIIAISALTVAIFNSSFITSQRTTSSADRATSWLYIAKQRAKRDGLPRGVRFLVNAPGGTALPELQGHVTDAQYIEVPDPWYPSTRLSATGPRIILSQTLFPPASPQAGQVQSRTAYIGFTGATAVSDRLEFLSLIQAGDFLQITDSNPKIRGSFLLTANPTTVGPNLNVGGQTYITQVLPLASFNMATQEPRPDLGSASDNPGPPAVPAMVISNFSFQQAARPMMGENTLQLGGQMVIDVRQNPNVANPANPVPTTFGANIQTSAGQQYFDILFSPSGTVMNSSGNIICLWVRNAGTNVLHPRIDSNPALTFPSNVDTRAAFDQAGEQLLVCVYPRTGMLAQHPIAPPPYNPPTLNLMAPYQFATDGQSSGF